MKVALAVVGVVLLVMTAVSLVLVGVGSETGAVSAGAVPSVVEPDVERQTGGAVATTPPKTLPSATETAPTGSADPTGSPAARAVEVWFLRGRYLAVFWRSVESTPRIGTAALEALLAGPAAGEQGAVGTQIPAATQLLGLAVDDRVATVDLSSEFEAGGDSSSLVARVAQVVYTLTQFPTVERVRFRLDGEPVDVATGDGRVVRRPVGRGDYEQLMPPIVVTEPAPGARAESPILVAGNANVFEANVTVRILDASGEEIARTFTTATCGSGCRGEFSVRLPYRSARDQRGTVVVSDDDADGDGSPQHEVRIPVLLGAT